MAGSDIERQLIEALERVAPEHAIDIVDVEVTGAKSAPVVRVRIDHADEELPTITLDEVSEQSDWINAVLDEVDPIPGSYTLEVSSPGMARPLRRARDFERFAGQTVLLTTYGHEGRRRYTGTLDGMVDGKVSVTCDDGTFVFDLVDVKSCTIKPTFDFGQKPQKGGSKKSKKNDGDTNDTDGE